MERYPENISRFFFQVYFKLTFHRLNKYGRLSLYLKQTPSALRKNIGIFEYRGSQGVQRVSFVSSLTFIKTLLLEVNITGRTTMSDASAGSSYIFNEPLTL